MLQNFKLVDIHAGGIRGHKIPWLLAIHSTGRLCSQLKKKPKSKKIKPKRILILKNLWYIFPTCSSMWSMFCMWKLEQTPNFPKVSTYTRLLHRKFTFGSGYITWPEPIQTSFVHEKIILTIPMHWIIVRYNCPCFHVLPFPPLYYSKQLKPRAFGLA